MCNGSVIFVMYLELDISSNFQSFILQLSFAKKSKALFKILVFQESTCNNEINISQYLLSEYHTTEKKNNNTFFPTIMINIQTSRAQFHTIKV